MQIRLNTAPTQHKPIPAKRPAFAANPLYHVRIRQVMRDQTVGYVPALISKLDYFDKGDAELLEGLNEAWRGQAKYIPQIFNAYKYKDPSYHIYTLERLNEPDPIKRVQSIMAVDSPDEPLHPFRLVIRFLQAAPEIADNFNSFIRGSGELMLYAGARLAKQKGLLHGLGVIADEHPFYQHLGMKYDHPPYEEDMYLVTSSKVDDFMRRIEKKYKFQDDIIDVTAETKPELEKLVAPERGYAVNPFGKNPREVIWYKRR